MPPTTLLNFEATWPQHNGAKDHAIRTQLGITPVRYYQLLNRAVLTVDGIAADPVTARIVRQRLARVHGKVIRQHG